MNKFRWNMWFSPLSGDFVLREYDVRARVIQWSAGL